MEVLVAYATRHGATSGIADRLAKTLSASGVPAESLEVSSVKDVSGYDAVVVGSAAYMFHWLKDASAFVEEHADELRTLPVWLFSSGPLGTDLVTEDGEDVFEASRPKEFDEFSELIEARGEAVFFGAYDPDAKPIGLAERFLHLLPASKDALPAGDFRDWDAIDTWAREIATDLTR